MVFLVILPRFVTYFHFTSPRLEATTYVCFINLIFLANNARSSRTDFHIVRARDFLYIRDAFVCLLFGARFRSSCDARKCNAELHIHVKLGMHNSNNDVCASWREYRLRDDTIFVKKGEFHWRRIFFSFWIWCSVKSSKSEKAYLRLGG